MANALPTPADDEQSFAEAWESIPAGSRAHKGVYAAWKTEDGALLISYKPDHLGEGDEDLHFEIPAQIIQLMVLGSQGKLTPLQAMSALRNMRGLGGL